MYVLFTDRKGIIPLCLCRGSYNPIFHEFDCFELAGKLAKDAIRNGIESRLAVPLKEFKNIWKEKMFDNFLECYKRMSQEKIKVFSTAQTISQSEILLVL